MRKFWKLEFRKSVMGQRFWLTYRNGQREECFNEENAYAFENHEVVEEMIESLRLDGYSYVWVSTYFVDIKQIAL